MFMCKYVIIKELKINKSDWRNMKMAGGSARKEGNDVIF